MEVMSLLKLNANGELREQIGAKLPPGCGVPKHMDTCRRGGCWLLG